MELNIYVLECENNKYYVGKTTQTVEQRFSQHIQESNFCAFTNKYKPMKIIEVTKSSDPLDEDKVTKRYMMTHGIDNVRGGAYTKLELEDWQIKSLNHEFTSSSDSLSTNLCFHCGKSGHFANSCPNLVFNIDQFVDKYNDESSICHQIYELKKLFEQVYNTKNSIEGTKICTMENYNQLIKFNQCENSTNESRQMNANISTLHQKYLNKNNIYIEFLPIEIKMLELVNFNINMQIQLKALLTTFKTQEIIQNILVKLYEKLIGITTKVNKKI